MRPIISIIVPIFNVADYLGQCIDSILNQTFKNFELILINDGSLDKSGEICNEYANRDARIRVIHKKNEGVSSARNTGLNVAKGKFIGFIDPDDDIEPNMYQILYEDALRNTADIVICPIRTINFITNDMKISTVWEEVNVAVDKTTIKNFIIPSIVNRKYYSLLSCCNKLYRRSCFDDTKNRFDESRNHGEDARLNIRLLEQINSIVFVEEPLYNYYVRKRNSLTQIFRTDFYDYILDNKVFGMYLCNKYSLSSLIGEINNKYLFSTLNYIEDTVNSTLSMDQKLDILTKIFNDTEFRKSINEFYESRFYYKLFAWLCIHNHKRILISVIKGKSYIKALKNKIYLVLQSINGESGV